MPLPALIVGAAGLAGKADDAWDMFSGFFGGGNDDKYRGKPAPGQPADAAVAAFINRLDPSDRAALEDAWHAANPSLRFSSQTPFTIGHGAFGGDDGKHGSKNGQELGRVWSELWRHYMSGGGSPVLAAEQEQSAAERLLEELRRAGSDWVDSGKAVLTGTLEGAASGARAGSSGALTGAQLGAFSMSHVFAGVLVVLVVVLLLRGRK